MTLRLKLKRPKLQFRVKGSATSGNWGHAGNSPKHGGSAKRSVAMSISTGRDWKRRQTLKRLETARTGTTIEDYDAFELESSAWLKTLTKSEKGAVGGYTFEGNKAVNGCLRRGEGCSDDVTDNIFEINQALSKASAVSVDTILYRGVDVKYIRDLQVGDTYKDNGFVSTSAFVREVESFPSDAIVQVVVPKGSKAGGYIGLLSDQPDEGEWLLPSGSIFEIISRGGDAGRGPSGPRELIIMLYVESGGEKEIGTKAVKKRAAGREDYFVWQADDLVLVSKPKVRIRKK